MKIPALLLAFAFAAAVFAADRPNILFAIADDWGWPHAGAYGDPVVKTPTFDRIAAEGALFHHAYISSPSCTPSRNAILTGQYHWRLGPGANLWSTLDPAIPTYPRLLRDAGYHVGHWRKSWGPGRLTGWDGDHPAGRSYGKGFDAFLADRPEGAPFCFWLGASDPHRGYQPGSGRKSGMDLAEIKLPACFPDSETVRSDVADYYFEVQRFDSDVGKAIATLERLGELDDTIVFITGDHGMPFPRGKGNLYDTGARVCLAARWGAKVKPKQVVEAFVSTTDLAPTFLDAAGVDIPEAMTGRSLLPILAGRKPEGRGFVVTGKERHTPCQEAPITGGTPMRAIRTHDFLYIHNLAPDRWPAGTPDWRKAQMPGAWLGDCDNGPTKTYMVDNADKDDTHRTLHDLAFAKRPEHELYELRSDPDQLRNVAGDSRHAKELARLQEQLQAVLAETNDPRAGGGGEEFDAYPYYGGVPKHPDAGRKKRK